jgi:hypothetical protein
MLVLEPDKGSSLGHLSMLLSHGPYRPLFWFQIAANPTILECLHQSCEINLS